MEKESYIKIVDTGEGYLISGFNSPAECAHFFYAFIIHLYVTGFSFEELRAILSAADVSFHCGSVDVVNTAISS